MSAQDKERPAGPPAEERLVPKLPQRVIDSAELFAGGIHVNPMI